MGRPRRVKVVPDNLHCCDCGGTSISGNGNCWWDVNRQTWAADNVDNFYCSDCQNECQVVWCYTLQLNLFGLETDEQDLYPYASWQEHYFKKELDNDEWINKRGD